ncbi:MAG: porphobilinogen synthase [Flavobacteriales bacterium]|nr:porphobilinogen synthase [Flavobacteriales bacterium]MDG1766992.1 porphobilinogen synthase [Flavobacteriales bacterium]
MQQRPRRNRRTEAIRGMVRETRVHTDQLIYPLFLINDANAKEAINALPGQYRFGLNHLLKEIEESLNLGLSSFVLFPGVADELKDKTASYSYAEENFYLHAIRAVKERFPEACLMSDVAMDPYSADGHDGFVQDGKILNDETLPILNKMAIAQAQAGIDILGPSDMMDGRVASLRDALDGKGFEEVAIMSYTAKYASAFYGPFREALDSAPKAGDKKTYQMDPANRREALREAALDMDEGADYLMVKPALCYLDIISDLKANCDVPISAYNVSGEYAMLKAAAERGWINYEQAMPEMLTSIVRAGADIVLTYFAKEFAQMQKR